MEFKLRPFEINDLQSLVKYANNAKIAQFMTNQFPHPYTEETGKAFIEFCMSHNPTRIFTFEINGKASGGIGIHPQADIMCKNAELGYWLAEPFWNLGIVSKAVIQALDYGFKTFDINRIYARPFSNNLASQKVLEKCGFKLEARIEKNIFKNGEYLDELIYAVRRG
ncbi:MAG: GNAT family N-acetyltransferase [Bacteroidetes bacterium]|nr:GNAT family N-acetyltransferase [Bacteroidota bacterium]MBL0053389.1 GNAT family N-acetyltransferase [Bacteroidota bacterium]